MSEEASTMVLFSPAIFAAVIMMLAGSIGGHINVLALVITDVVALVLGFFVVFTVAWAVTSSATLIWLTAAAIGVLVGATGHFVARGKVHG